LSGSRLLVSFAHLRKDKKLELDKEILADQYEGGEAATEAALLFGQNVRCLGLYGQRKFARLVLEVSRRFYECGCHLGIGRGLGHLEQRQRCLPGMKAVLRQGTNARTLFA